MSFNHTIYYYYLALTGYFGLFILLMLWHTVLITNSSFPIALQLIITVVPLLIPLRGLLDKNPKSCAWAAYISLIYFIHGSAESYVNLSERPLALLETFLSLLLFFGANFYVRGMKKNRE